LEVTVKTFIATLTFLLAAAVLATAQGTDEQNKDHRPLGLGYVFVGGASHSMGLTAGMGGELSSSTGLGMGLEVGAIAFTRKGDQYYDSYTTGVSSADVLYHYYSKKANLKDVSPFVAGGYTILFGHNSVPLGKDVETNGFNIGGGVDLFATKHAGLRFDVRYYGHGGRILKNAYPDVAEFSFVAFRIGLTFR
jgi:hypothetical protein